MNSKEKLDTGDQVGSVQLVDRDIVPFRNLPGFQKHHRVPTRASATDHRFLVDITVDELDADLQEIFSALRKAYGLKRKEIEVSGPSDGGGSIMTPFFCYSIEVEQSESEPENVIRRRSIGDITEPARVFAGPFEQVFGNQFSELEVKTRSPLDLESIVDHIEDAEASGVELDYDKDLSWCEVTMVDLLATVKLQGDTIRVVNKLEASPQAMLETFLEVQQRFISTLNLANVPFLSERS